MNGNEYRAVFTGPGGSATSSAATLTVGAPPVLTTQLPPSITCVAGTTVTLTIQYTSSTPVTVQWQVSTNGGGTFSTISGANSNTLTLPCTPSIDGNEYRPVITNQFGSFAGSPVTIHVTTPLAITIQPANASVTVGSTATFTAGASGSPVPAVQWQVSTNGGSTFTNDTTDAGNTTGILTVANATLPQSGNEYRAVFTNSAGSATTSAATLTVTGVAPAVTTQPANASVTAGAAATFTAAASGTPAPTVQWQVSTNGGGTFSNDTTDAGATTGTLTVSATTTSESGYEYRAVFTNAAGSATTAAATLTVKPNNAPTVTRVFPSTGGPFSLVLISGTNFTHVSAVSFGTKHALFLSLSSKLVIALAPTQGSGKVDVTVTTKAGTSATSSADQFTYR
jgi:hypothetical protein